MQKIVRIILFAILGVFLNISSSKSEENFKPENEKGFLTLIFENDALSGTDQGYTNGFRISYTAPEINMSPNVRKMADYFPLPEDGGKKRVSFALGQSIFTPSNTEKDNPDPSDRPYAGWLYASFGLSSDTGKTLNNMMVTLGMVGPSARAEQVQQNFHHLIGAGIPNGWNHQLKNEPGIVLTYERKWREVLLANIFSVKGDFMPHVGVNLGNVNTDASIGGTFRLGFNLPADYGPPRIRPSLPGTDFFVPTRGLGGYLFATFEGRAVARNIFLDGNTFQSSPHVHKKSTVGSVQIGFAVTYLDTRISLAHIYLTKEFKTQSNAVQEFDALTLSWRF